MNRNDNLRRNAARERRLLEARRPGPQISNRPLRKRSHAEFKLIASPKQRDDQRRRALSILETTSSAELGLRERKRLRRIVCNGSGY